MWSKKRQRYVFRKRSRRGRILWLLVGTLMLVGLLWFIPWQTLSSVEIPDTLRSVASKDQPEQAPVEDQPEQAPVEDQPEQAPVEDQPEQADTQDQPEQGSTSDLPRNEAALEGTPPKEERASNVPVSPSPPAAQLSPPPQAPSTPGVEEVPRNFLSPNDYWYPESDSNDYWYPEPGDYGDYYYWDY
jgi:cytoskeletal protein RodZ